MAGSGALLAALLITTAAAGALAPTATCNGLEATIEVTAGVDDGYVEGTEGDDVMVVRGTNVQQLVDGLGGDDTICTYQVETVAGGPGNDFIQVLDGPDTDDTDTVTVDGGDGNDEIHGSDLWHERLGGGPGNDVIFGYGGWDIIGGEDGDDVIYGNAGDDYLLGGGGTDTIYGGWGEDFLYGGDADGDLGISETPDADDLLFGGPGNDYLAGQRGADSLYGGDGNDMLISNESQDLADISNTTPAELFDVAGSRMFGGAGDDLIVGSNRWDRMQGGPGHDTLFGFEGRDYIRGGRGDDNIVGGTGTDDINGNTGADHLIYEPGELTSGGWGIDRCETSTRPTPETPRACERTGMPTLEYTPPSTYTRLHDQLVG